LPNFFEEITDWIGGRRWSTYKKQRSRCHGARAPLNKNLNQALGIHCEDGIFRNNRD
jgi:hypothetical protein